MSSELTSKEEAWEDSRPFTVKDRRAPTIVQPHHQQQEDEDDDDDSLFELTSADLARLQADLIRRGQAAAEEEQSLRTKRMRETARREQILGKCRSVVFQIRFPNDHVLEAEFKSTETSQDIYNFVRSHLQDPSTDFQLSNQALRAKPLEMNTKDDKNQLWKQGFYVNTILRVTSKTPIVLRSSSAPTTTAAPITTTSSSSSTPSLSPSSPSSSPSSSSSSPLSSPPPSSSSPSTPSPTPQRPALTPEQREALVLKKLGISTRRH